MSVGHTIHETIAAIVTVEARGSCQNCFLASAYAFEEVALDYSVSSWNIGSEEASREDSWQHLTVSTTIVVRLLEAALIEKWLAVSCVTQANDQGCTMGVFMERLFPLSKGESTLSFEVSTHWNAFLHDSSRRIHSTWTTPHRHYPAIAISWQDICCQPKRS